MACSIVSCRAGSSTGKAPQGPARRTAGSGGRGPDKEAVSLTATVSAPGWPASAFDGALVGAADAGLGSGATRPRSGDAPSLRRGLDLPDPRHPHDFPLPPLRQGGGEPAGMSSGRAAADATDRGGLWPATPSSHSPASPREVKRPSELSGDHQREGAKPSSRGEQASRSDSSAPRASGEAIVCSASLRALRVTAPRPERSVGTRRGGGDLGLRCIGAPATVSLSAEAADLAPSPSGLRLTPTPGRLGGERGEVSTTSAAEIARRHEGGNS
jgi:hypothetical protein